MDEKVHICITIPISIEAAEELFRDEDVRYYESLDGTEIHANTTLTYCLHLIELVGNIDHDVKVRRIFNG